MQPQLEEGCEDISEGYEESGGNASAKRKGELLLATTQSQTHKMYYEMCLVSKAKHSSHHSVFWDPHSLIAKSLPIHSQN